MSKTRIALKDVVWWVGFTLSVLIGVGCKSRSGADQPATRVTDVRSEPLTGRPPFLTFDSTAFINERIEAIEAVAPFMRDNWEFETFKERVHEWVSNGLVQSFWSDIHASIGVQSVLFTWELGSTEESGYSLRTIVRSEHHIIAIHRANYSDTSLQFDTLTTAKWEEIVQRTTAICLSAPEDKFFADGEDLPVHIIMLYSSEIPVALVSNCGFACFDSSVSDYYRYLRSVFGY